MTTIVEQERLLGPPFTLMESLDLPCFRGFGKDSAQALHLSWLRGKWFVFDSAHRGRKADR
jgi:hypothetical protein